VSQTNQPEILLQYEELIKGVLLWKSEEKWRTILDVSRLACAHALGPDSVVSEGSAALEIMMKALTPLMDAMAEKSASEVRRSKIDELAALVDLLKKSDGLFEGKPEISDRIKTLLDQLVS